MIGQTRTYPRLVLHDKFLCMKRVTYGNYQSDFPPPQIRLAAVGPPPLRGARQLPLCPAEEGTAVPDTTAKGQTQLCGLDFRTPEGGGEAVSGQVQAQESHGLDQVLRE